MAQEESIEFLTLHSATHSEGIKAKDACRLVMHPDDAKKLLDQLLEGKDDVMRLILNENYLEYNEFLEHRVKRYNDSAADKELEYVHLRLLSMFTRLWAMNWHLKKIENEESRADASRCLLGLFNAAVPEVFGVRVSSPNARRYAQGQQAKTARTKRSERPEEQALQRAIEAELCGRDVARPSKEAEAMLNRVNEALSHEGFAPVKRGVIRRRLEKKSPLFKNGPKILSSL